MAGIIYKAEEGDLYERLAEVKATIKDLEEAAKLIVRDIIEEGPIKKVSTTKGLLSFNTRENYKVEDVDAVINMISQDQFNQRAKISKTGIVAAGGQNILDALLDCEAVVRGEDTQYFSLRAVKK